MSSNKDLNDAFYELSLKGIEKPSDSSESASSLRKRMHHRELTMRELPLYEISISHIEKFDRESQMKKSWRNNECIGRKNETDYVETAKAMVWLEEIEQSKSLKKFNQTNVRIIKRLNDFRNTVYCFENEEKMKEILSAYKRNTLDRFILKKMLSFRAQEGIQGRITGTDPKEYFINFELIEEEEKKLDFEAKYEIDFILNRLPYQVQHNALHYVQTHNLFENFINNRLLDNPNILYELKGEHSVQIESELFSHLNKEQREAVQNIIAAENQPLPYILYGPPGTGKTATLVAAIESIVRNTSKNVLVCANSNAACDEITGRLVDVLTEDELLRLYTKNFDHRKMNSELESYSNWNRRTFHHPAMEHLLEFRVIVCTLCTAACLTRSEAQIPPNAFSHIIIDEAASTHETMAMVAIAGLCTDSKGIRSSVVLAGDPLQLDAVTMSKEAVALGFKTSLMEHLFKRRLYQRDPSTGKFNKTFITQLVKNYRSHSSILHMPSKLFYDGTLQARASSDVADWFIGSTILPSDKFPIIFHDVCGTCSKSAKSASLFNAKEVDVVVDYIIKLLKQKPKDKSVESSDIGVVAPYKLQCTHISQAIRRKDLGNITVGTAEIFQGQEKPIMIVSTVRSGGNNLGFVSDSRRLNVMITRAKSLLIIIGNRLTLSQDRNWAEFIQYCNDNNGLIKMS